MGARLLLDHLCLLLEYENQLELFKAADLLSFKNPPKGKGVPVSFKDLSADPTAKGELAQMYRLYEMRCKGHRAGYVAYQTDYRSGYRETIEINMVHVDPAFRGKGLGLHLYKAFFAFVRRRYPYVTHITGEVTSQRVARLRQKALSTPAQFGYSGTGNHFPEEDLPAQVPLDSPEDENGRIDTDRYAFMTQPLRHSGLASRRR